MKLIIDIPDNEVPKRREIVEIGLQFMDGEICECTYPFQILPKGHGRLIDADNLKNNMEFICMDIMAGTGTYNAPVTEIDNAQTIIEADKEAEDD